MPRVDEHATVVAAEPEAVWQATARVVARAFSRPAAARYARAVGADPGAVTGPWPPAEGSTLPGFRVTAAVPGRLLELTGRHRFSSYTLTFALDPVDTARTRLRAETRAVFPGLAGRAYRLLVITSGGHAVGVRRLLGSVAASLSSAATGGVS
ncbi:hypothetical protein [Streptomyces sp. NPDC003717]|uniref:hypothetical protein n=1 Tax=Streptomyces sp. NPDC003717 TaxID=3154276 RepID=UPI0033A30A54